VTERRRTIRSFVRRTGRLTASQQRARDELWPRFGADFSGELLPLDTLFPTSSGPLVVEIGFGNGKSLVELAAQHPEHRFLGIEVHDPGIGHCMLTAERADVHNLRVLRHDAIDVLRDGLAPSSIDRLNLYFPDPWPKKRHHKRRILNAAFLELVHSRLADHGALHIATDWANYAEHIDTLFQTSPGFALDERREHDGDRPFDRPVTKFERRGLKEGHRIVDWRFIRR